MSRIKLVQGDTGPIVYASLTDADAGTPIDLSEAGTSVRMRFRKEYSTTTLVTLVGTKLTGQVLADGSVNTDPPYDVAGKGGRVSFSWGLSDLDQSAGDYEGEIEVTFADGTIQSVYELIKFVLRAGFGD